MSHHRTNCPRCSHPTMYHAKPEAPDRIECIVRDCDCRLTEAGAIELARTEAKVTYWNTR